MGLYMPHGHIVSGYARCGDGAPILGGMLFQAGSLLLVIISVYLLKRIHIFSDKSYKVVQGLVFNLTLPDNARILAHFRIPALT